jgi:hypothetical protein
VKSLVTLDGMAGISLALRCTIFIMSGNDQISKVMSEMGRLGGLARAKALSAKQRRESASKASKAAAKARTRAARKRKDRNE